MPVRIISVIEYLIKSVKWWRTNLILLLVHDHPERAIYEGAYEYG